jgi:hypothetical protein
MPSAHPVDGPGTLEPEQEPSQEDGTVMEPIADRVKKIIVDQHGV